MRLLIIGDLKGQIGAASAIAHNRGARVTQVADVEAGLNALREGNGADLIMAEVKVDIARLIAQLKAERINIPVVACGIDSDSKAAVAAIKAGAKEYIPLPPDETLIAAVLEAITEESHAMIYASPAMARVVDLAEQVAGSEASVLLTGESGTGKEVLARFLHRKSKRNNKPFISVNCAAIPETLLESELFGYEKGAFTGAVSRRIGKFEEGSSGTLLLDEISEMDVRLQAKLLRAIQEKEIDRIGGKQPVKVDLRIIATSNRDLQAEVKKGTFREDLYFRLNVISIEIPPLRERPEDIAPIARHFIEKYSKANGVPPRPLAEEALHKLTGYDWPGNVRELENTLHRSVLMARGNTIDTDAILLPRAAEAPQPRLTGTGAFAPMPATALAPASSFASPLSASAQDNQPRRNEMVGRTVAEVEKELIIDTLDYCLGNRTHAANILGISIRTLRNKLKAYGETGDTIPSPQSESSSKAAY